MVANTNGAIVELCPKPTPANSPQQMTIYGQKTGVATPQTPKSVPISVGTLTPTTGWTTSANALLIDARNATHAVTNAAPVSVLAAHEARAKGEPGGGAPVKVDMGPWEHAYPDDGVPGPTYEWRERGHRQRK